MSERILFVPECRKEKGSGHVIRSLRLSKTLCADIYLPHMGSPAGDSPYHPQDIAASLDPFWTLPEHKERIHRQLPAKTFTKIVFDMPSLSYAEFQTFHADMTIGLDCGGEARASLSYLIDTLPNFYENANVHSAGLNILPDKRRDAWPKKIRKLFVTFGGGDKESKENTVRELLRNQYSNYDIHVAAHVLQTGEKGYDINTLCEYDLVITHFGLLAYESLWARVPVLLINPSSYHERLTKKAGLYSIPWKRHISFPDIETLFPTILKASKHACPKQQQDVAMLIHSLRPTKNTYERGSAIARFPNRSFFFSQPATVRLAHYSHEEKEYEEDYFFDEYKKQYGCDYMEDADAIYTLGKLRMQRIQRCRSRGVLLDVGCAYGHFLRAAKDSGYEAHGIDISEAAIRYVMDRLKISAICGDIRALDLSKIFSTSYFDVLSLWYVIEHFQDPLSIVETLLPVLRPGGILCFSAPSLAGVSARFHALAFFETSPPDHFVLWNPWHLKEIFRPLGLKLLYWVSTGHHPERFPLAKSSFARILYKGLSRVFRLGDTFEAYFVKEDE